MTIVAEWRYALIGVGATAGWIAGRIMEGGGFGLLGNVIVGVLGSWLGKFLGGKLGVGVEGGIFTNLITAVIGAVILLFIVGMFLGVALILIKAPAPMLIAVGMYLPFGTTSAVFAGGLIKATLEWFMKRREATEEEKTKGENSGVLVASGLIAGQSLMAVVLAFVVLYEKAKLQLPDGQHILPHISHEFWLSLLVYPLLLLMLVWIPLRRMRN